MKDYSVMMALVDFVPVALFGAAAVILMRDLYNKMSKGAFALFAAGCIDIVCAGGLKALYKLLYAAGVCDFAPLNTLMLPLQSIGFMLAGVGAVAMLTHRQKAAALAVAPPVFSGTFVFVTLMVAGLGMLNTVLSVLAAKCRKGWVIALFVLSFVCSLCMGYLASRDFTQAAMNWLAEAVNVMGQGAFLLGAVLLHKAGLAALHLRDGDVA